MAGPERVVTVKSWDELPRVLESGVYIVDGERILVRERVPRDVLKRATITMKRRKGIYI